MDRASVSSERTHALALLFRNYHGPNFSVQLPDWTWSFNPASPPSFVLIFRNPASLRALLHAPSETHLGEAFVSGDLDISGDLYAAIEAVETLLLAPRPRWSQLLFRMEAILAGISRWLTRGARHSRKRDAAAIAHHYDLPADFYEPFLGPTLLYSAAYFRDLSQSLDSAQNAKLDLICRKLSLTPGERFLDVGCGWGSLVMHAASRFGASARGITISHRQAETAARRITRAHMTDCCFVERRDYRDIPTLPYVYDKAASIGMFEHVGLRNLRKYFEAVYAVLRPNGLFLNSGIVRHPTSASTSNSFMDRYVFPDGELPTLPYALEQAEAAGFEVRDVENLREHYAATCRWWVKNLKDKMSELREIESDRTLRIWLLYMAGCAVAFEHGEMGVCQVLLKRCDPGKGSAPGTREPWYQSAHPLPGSAAA